MIFGGEFTKTNTIKWSRTSLLMIHLRDPMNILPIKETNFDVTLFVFVIKGMQPCRKSWL